MKISLTLRPRRALPRAEAWACLSANLALPGAGSLAAGRKAGYAQMALAFGGLAVSVAAGIPMIEWGIANWGRIMQPAPADDPLGPLLELWVHARWPLAGIGIFLAGFLWAAATGLRLVAGAPRDGVPPRIV
ncbi:MAG: hypothetical protein ABSH38_16880 [Verrucomicrobiota bacterium]|jgi:hypothetical protein